VSTPVRCGHLPPMVAAGHDGPRRRRGAAGPARAGSVRRPVWHRAFHSPRDCRRARATWTAVVHPLVVLGYFLGSRWRRGQYLLTCCRRETVSGREVILTRFPWRLDIPTHNHNRCRCFNKRHPRGIAAIHLFLDGDTTRHGHQHRAGHIAGFSGPYGTQVALTAAVTPAKRPAPCSSGTGPPTSVSRCSSATALRW
jgi:hypothetical protein